MSAGGRRLGAEVTRRACMRWLYVCALSWSGAGCGGASEAPSAGTHVASSSAVSSDAPETKCLALANAARTKKPGEPDTIKVSHVLVKHVESKSAPAGLARTRGGACLRAIEVRDKLIGGADFDAVVAEYSDESGAASRSGSIGEIHRADVVPAFADAAFELERGQLSDVIETEFGFHLILRTE